MGNVCYLTCFVCELSACVIASFNGSNVSLLMFECFLVRPR